MTSSTHRFLTLAPATHETAVILALGAPTDKDSVVGLQKARRSSSTATTDSTSVEELLSPPESAVASPVEDVAAEATPTTFLKLGY